MSLFDKLIDTIKRDPIPPNIKVDYDYDSGRWLYKDNIISYVNEELERRRQEKAPLEMLWQLIINFLAGNQYCDINLATMQIEDIGETYAWLEKEVFNRMDSIYDTRQTKLSRIKASMTVKSGSNELKDLARARVSKAILKGSQIKLKDSDMQPIANMWMDMLGTVFHMDWWNPQAGRKVFEFENVTKTEDGQEHKKVNAVFEGDLASGILTPFEVFPDSIFNQKLADCQSIILDQVLSEDLIYNLYGVRITGRTIDTFALVPTINSGGLGYNAYINTIGIQQKKNSEHVKTYMELPSRDFPEGKMAIIIGDTYMPYYGPLPYKVGEDQRPFYNLTRVVCIERAGCFFGKTPYERMLPVQRAYNTVKNRKHDYLNRVAIQAYKAPVGAVDVDKLQEEGIAPGSIVEYALGKDGLAPLEIGQLPTEFRDEEVKLQRELEYLAGTSEMSVISSAPVGVESGTAIESVKQSDDARVALTGDNIRNGAIERSKQRLRIYKQFAIGPRIMQFTGNNDIANVVVWDRNDIGSYDIVHETENELIDTPEQRKQTVFIALQNGIFKNDEGIIDRRTRTKLYKMLNLGENEDFLDINQLQMTRAQRENTYLETSGILPKVRDFDDHEIHVEEHNLFRLSTDYEILEMEKPGMCSALDAHVKEHEGRLAMIAQQMQLMAAAQNQTQVK